MGLVETGCEGVDWINLAQSKVDCRAFVNMVINCHVLLK
jgi:hypothetical protein